MKQRCVNEFLHAEKTAPTDNHQHLLNIYGDQAVDVSTVRLTSSNGSSNTMSPPFMQIFMSAACRLLFTVAKMHSYW